MPEKNAHGDERRTIYGRRRCHASERPGSVTGWSGLRSALL